MGRYNSILNNFPPSQKAEPAFGTHKELYATAFQRIALLFRHFQWSRHHVFHWESEGFCLITPPHPRFRAMNKAGGPSDGVKTKQGSVS